ncbi:MAG TPA: Asp-tRNA(Asn)/Glu-tRNA(Gln) amidotransferase GatCAB subunit A, partial [Gammaproteobacteria bacterium]|nr:Asp-tRNA(Asn)/Glu-tRNA(Gln) amidotransferase GatCAB subunit A [Gammaproteobacteria bacterium]
SSVELTQHFIRRIEKLDAKLNSLITINSDLALQRAAEADRQLAKGEANPLCGVPYIHKDIFCTQGIRTSCASRMLHDFIAP